MIFNACHTGRGYCRISNETWTRRYTVWVVFMWVTTKNELRPQLSSACGRLRQSQVTTHMRLKFLCSLTQKQVFLFSVKGWTEILSNRILIWQCQCDRITTPVISHNWKESWLILMFPLLYKVLFRLRATILRACKWFNNNDEGQKYNNSLFFSLKRSFFSN